MLFWSGRPKRDGALRGSRWMGFMLPQRAPPPPSGMASIFKSPRVTAIPSLRASSRYLSAGASKRHLAHWPTDTGAVPESGRRARKIRKTLWNWQIATASFEITDEIYLAKYSQKGSKKGRHSVGVARQYCGQLGKQDNCQVAVTLSLANDRASL